MNFRLPFAGISFKTVQDISFIIQIAAPMDQPVSIEGWATDEVLVRVVE
jgi:hypothetical protein